VKVHLENGFCMAPIKFDGKIRKPMKFGEGMQPGTVEWELNRRRLRAERHEDNRQWAEIQAKRHEREREPHSIWWSFFRIFKRFWPE